MMARPITMPVEAPIACTTRAPISAPIEEAAMAASEATTVERQPGQHDRPAAEAVGQRAEQQLGGARLEQIKRQRELHRAGVGGELRRPAPAAPAPGC